MKDIKKIKRVPSCEDCEHFDYDEEMGEHVCNASAAMDEDDYGKMMSSNGACPYYKYYNEYKFVQTQN